MEIPGGNCKQKMVECKVRSAVWTESMNIYRTETASIFCVARSSYDEQTNVFCFVILNSKLSCCCHSVFQNIYLFSLVHTHNSSETYANERAHIIIVCLCLSSVFAVGIKIKCINYVVGHREREVCSRSERDGVCVYRRQREREWKILCVSGCIGLILHSAQSQQLSR